MAFWWCLHIRFHLWEVLCQLHNSFIRKVNWLCCSYCSTAIGSRLKSACKGIQTIICIVCIDFAFKWSHVDWAALIFQPIYLYVFNHISIVTHRGPSMSWPIFLPSKFILVFPLLPEHLWIRRPLINVFILSKANAKTSLHIIFNSEILLWFLVLGVLKWITSISIHPIHICIALRVPGHIIKRFQLVSIYWRYF